MGLFSNLFGSLRHPKINGFWKTLTAYTPSFNTWRGDLYESELCRSAMDARARNISKLKIQVQGTAKPFLQTKLRLGPNQWQTWGQFLYRLSTILDIQNTAFIVPVLGSYGDVTGIYPILPSRCEIVDVSGEPWLRYKFSTGDVAAIELASVGIMTKYQYQDDFFGSSNTALNETMSLIEIQNQGITEGIKNSATYRFMAKLGNFSKSEDVAKERKRFSEENLQSDSDAGGLLLFPNTYNDPKQIISRPYTIDAAQMEYIRTNVFNYFGVNSDILQNKAFGDAWSAFYEGCIEVFSVQLSDVLTKMLFTDRERAQGSFIIATANRLQYMSNTDKLNVSSQMADRGLFTINEIRDIWNMDPLPDGDKTIARGEYKETGSADPADPAEEDKKDD